MRVDKDKISKRVGAWSLWPAAMPTDCGCKWLWYRKLASGDLYYSGCVHHGSGALWSRKTRRLAEVPDATT